MIKLYHENPEFNEFTQFDTQTGKSSPISEACFYEALSKCPQTKDISSQSFEGKDTIIFDGETSSAHTRFPRRIYFQITRKCNLNCPACFIKADSHGKDVPTEFIMDIATFLGQHGLMEVRLTGGEPTCHPDIIDIIHKFQEENVYVSLGTNGVFSKRMLEALSEEKHLWLICSIDGNKDTHNKYRPNTYDAIISNLRYLKEKNPDIRIRINTVLTKENKDQMYDMGCLCKSLDVESITVIPLRPQVRDPEIRKQMVTASEFKQVLDDLVEVKRKLNINFTTTIETDYKNYIYRDSVFIKRSSCAAGREGTNLDYDADKNRFLLYGCSYSPASDLSEDPALRAPFLAGTFTPDNISAILDIWRDDNAWTIYRDLSLKPVECQNCEYYHNHLCTGSCPIQNIDYSAIDVNEDILEQLKQILIETGEWYCYKKIINNGIKVN